MAGPIHDHRFMTIIVTKTPVTLPRSHGPRPRMISRRHFSHASCWPAWPCRPAAFGQTVDGIRRAARGMGQLHALLVQRGDEVIVAEAPRGPGLDRAANIKSCSKSIVALLLGTDHLAR